MCKGPVAGVSLEGQEQQGSQCGWSRGREGENGCRGAQRGMGWIVGTLEAVLRAFFAFDSGKPVLRVCAGPSEDSHLNRPPWVLCGERTEGDKGRHLKTC